MTEDRQATGMKIRRAVVGDEYVDRAIANTTEFSAPLQELLNDYCWGWLWTRDGLPLTTRSLLNVAILSVLNRPNELKVHIRGALRNGCSEAEIRETLLQVAVYAGVPCGVDSFKIAREVLDQEKAETAGP